MNLEELRSVQDAERHKSGLQPLRESFYEEAGEYIADLKRERERAADRADDPFSSPEVRQISDEIETAEEVLEAIYERRMGKLLKRAGLAAAEMSVDDDGLTAEERELFEDLVDRISRSKTRVLETLAGEADPVDPADPADPDASSVDRTGTPERGPVAGSPSEPDGDRHRDGGSSTANENRPTTDAVGTGTTGGDRATEGTDAGVDRHEVDPEPAPDAVTGPADPARDRSADLDSDDRSSATGGPNGDTDGGSERVIEGTSDPAADGGTGPVGADPGPPPATAPGTGESAGSTGSGSTPGAGGRVTVRITDEVGAIYGVDDREYDLSTDDVVALPEANADPLVERGAAEHLDCS